MTERNYAEALKAEFGIEIQSEVFGFDCTIYIEGSNCEYHDKYLNCVSNEGNVKMNLHSHISDDSDHNVATIFEHMKIFIHRMY